MSSEKDDPRSNSSAGQSEARESSPYELEDHLALFKKTPTPSSTPNGTLHNESDFSFDVSRFAFEPGKRDTLTMEIPTMEESSKQHQEASGEASLDEDGSGNVFNSFLVHGAPLTPVTEIDENLRSPHRTTDRTISTQATVVSAMEAARDSRRPTGRLSTPSQPFALHRHSTNNEERISSPVEGIVKSDRKAEPEATDKSARKSKGDLPKKHTAEMMEVDEDQGRKDDSLPPQSPRSDIRSSETKMSPRAAPSRRRRSSQKAQGQKERSRSVTPPKRRPSTRLSCIKEGLLEKLSSDPGTWKSDLRTYLDFRLYGMDKSAVQQAAAYIDKLLLNNADADCWLEFLRLDWHKSVQVDPSDYMQTIRDTQSFAPSLKTLYLWGLKMSQDADLSDSYLALLRDYLRLKPAVHEEVDSGMLETVYAAWHGRDDGASPRPTSMARSTDLSLRDSLTDMEGQLIALLDKAT